MKLPDNEPLEADDYWQVQDTWKQEWERGVQVPVKPNGLPEPHVSAVVPSRKSERFTLPRKLICMNTSGSYRPETHQVTPMVLRAEQVCSYDLDNVDKAWLEALNGERALSGLNTVTESEMERTMEEMERQCRNKIHSTLRHTDDIDIGQDDNIICDVCRSVSWSSIEFYLFAYTIFNTSFHSRTLRNLTRWCFVTSAIFVCTRPVTASPTSPVAPGCAAPAPWASSRHVSFALTRVGP